MHKKQEAASLQFGVPKAQRKKKETGLLEQLALLPRYAGCFFVALCASHFVLPSDFSRIRRRPFYEWAAPLVLFNYVTVIVLYGFWHWFLYCGKGGGPVLSKLWPRKYCSKQDGYRVKQGFVLTMVGVGISSAAECMLWREVASGGAALQPGAFRDNLLRSVAMLVLIPMWIEAHAWVMHRVLHAWGMNVPLLGDPGNWLYRLIHWVRHESVNPGPWSGLSMHPLEHIMVFSSYVFPKFMPLHPLHIHFLTACSRIALLADSDGFDHPAGGGHRRHLHYACSCAGKKSFNYGGNDLFSLDEYFGTLDDGTGSDASDGIQ